MTFIELMIILNKNLESKQMGKQTFNQTKKILGILLVILFVAALTAPAISADKPHQQQQRTANIQHRAISQTALSNRYCCVA